MSYAEKLQKWFEREKREHGLVDIKFFPFFMLPENERPTNLEALCKSVYKTVTGKRETVSLDTSVL